MTCHSRHSEPYFELCRTDGNNFFLLEVRFLNSSVHQRWITGPVAQVFRHNFDPCSLCWALALASLTFCALFFHFLIVESLLLLFLPTLFGLFLRVDNSTTLKPTLRFFFGTVYILRKLCNYFYTFFFNEVVYRVQILGKYYESITLLILIITLKYKPSRWMDGRES